MTGASFGPGSRASHGAQDVSTLTGFDPSRVEATTWALNTVNQMVTLGIISNTVEARGKHLNALLDVLLGPEASS